MRCHLRQPRHTLVARLNDRSKMHCDNCTGGSACGRVALYKGLSGERQRLRLEHKAALAWTSPCGTCLRQWQGRSMCMCMCADTQLAAVLAVSATATAQQHVWLQGAGRGGGRLGYCRQGRRHTQLQLAAPAVVVAVAVAVAVGALGPGATVAPGGFAAGRGRMQHTRVGTRATCSLWPRRAGHCNAAAAAVKLGLTHLQRRCSCLATPGNGGQGLDGGSALWSAGAWSREGARDKGKGLHRYNWARCSQRPRDAGGHQGTGRRGPAYQYAQQGPWPWCEGPSNGCGATACRDERGQCLGLGLGSAAGRAALVAWACRPRVWSVLPSSAGQCRC